MSQIEQNQHFKISHTMISQILRNIIVIIGLNKLFEKQGIEK